MPNRPVHLVSSGVAGAVFANYRARQVNAIQPFSEFLGGAAGGLMGGILPDVFDPPTHPGHRSLAHALIPVGAGSTAWIRALDGWQARLRGRADEYSRLQVRESDPVLKTWYGAVATALRMLCGMLAGLVAGYLTHIVLDFATPRGLPLIS